MFSGLFGDGILTSNGADAKAQRALARPFFAKERIRDFNIVGDYAEKTLSCIRERAESGLSIDVQDLFARFTFDAAGEIFFGSKEFNTLDLPLPFPGKAKLGIKGSAVPETSRRNGKLLEAMDRLQDISFLRLLRGRFWAMNEFLKDETKEYTKIVDQFVYPLVAKALDNKKVRGDRKYDIDDGNLVDHLADASNDPKLIRDQLFTFLTAARDSTAALITFTIYMLSLHPGVVTKLRDEVISYVPSGLPTFEDVQKMKYLRAVLNETLRLLPPVPLNSRASKAACVVPGDRQTNGKPIYVPEDTQFLYSVLLMHRRKDLWGDDADNFDPERWIDKERMQNMASDSFMFLPFNGGPRICLGQNFAYNEASFMIIRVLQMFDTFTLRQKEDGPSQSCPPASWEGASGRKGFEKVCPRMSLTLFIKGGCWVQMGLARN